jgi:hypothetical protein
LGADGELDAGLIGQGLPHRLRIERRRGRV